MEGALFLLNLVAMLLLVVAAARAESRRGARDAPGPPSLLGLRPGNECARPRGRAARQGHGPHA